MFCMFFFIFFYLGFDPHLCNCWFWASCHMPVGHLCIIFGNIYSNLFTYFCLSPFIVEGKNSLFILYRIPLTEHEFGTFITFCELLLHFLDSVFWSTLKKFFLMKPIFSLYVTYYFDVISKDMKMHSSGFS